MNIQSMSNGRPSKGTATERVWAIADKLTREQGFKARRKQVIDAYMAEGGNINTGSTQYYYWSQQHDGASTDSNGCGPIANSGVIQLKIEGNGRMLIPSEFRGLMQLGESGRVAARIVDGELRLISPLVALRRLQAQAVMLVGENSGVVEEFLEEKREEASRE